MSVPKSVSVDSVRDHMGQRAFFLPDFLLFCPSGLPTADLDYTTLFFHIPLFGVCGIVVHQPVRNALAPSFPLCPPKARLSQLTLSYLAPLRAWNMSSISAIPPLTNGVGG